MSTAINASPTHVRATSAALTRFGVIGVVLWLGILAAVSVNYNLVYAGREFFPFGSLMAGALWVCATACFGIPIAALVATRGSPPDFLRLVVLVDLLIAMPLPLLAWLFWGAWGYLGQWLAATAFSVVSFGWIWRFTRAIDASDT